MKTVETKIRQQASRIARDYVAILQAGREPAALEYIMSRQKYGILDAIADDRLNHYKTLDRVESWARKFIKDDLAATPFLADRLNAFRKARHEREQEEAREEQRAWKALPAIA